jgi:hypothetical protein
LAAAFHLLAQVFEALALAPVDESLVGSSLGGQAKTGTARIRMSPSKSGIGEIKLSKTCIQMNKIYDFKKTIILIKTRVPYRIPFNPDMVGAHLLISRPAGGILEYFF